MKTIKKWKVQPEVFTAFLDSLEEKTSKSLVVRFNIRPGLASKYLSMYNNPKKIPSYDHKKEGKLTLGERGRNGLCCIECGIYFENSHGHKVVCEFCEREKRGREYPVAKYGVIG